ncbi:DUF421 domain-containing protein [Paenibacillus tarimensis]|nr:DUF421 domain-containing protein [Paenibacillus tarimensis]
MTINRSGRMELLYEILLVLFLIVFIWMAALFCLLGLLAESDPGQLLNKDLYADRHLQPAVSKALKRMPAGSKPAYRLEKLPVLLIAHGKVMEENLQQTGKTRFWLNREVSLAGLKGIRQVYWCTVNGRGELYILGDKNLG